ncbi:MAG: ABC transporter substrate-binding protein [Bacteroidetes bacterium]|nr:ABC transporter substrate-binding protein [Bacteroidota bacterium]
MKTNVLLIAVTILVIASAGLAFGSGQEEAEAKSVEITFWNGYTGPDRPAVEFLVDQFNAVDTMRTVSMEIMPWDSLFQKLMPALVAGNGPDVMGFSISRVSEFAEANRLEPLDSYLASSTTLAKADLVPGMVQGASFNGQLYGLPMAFASMVMYYNKEHFREAGLDPETPPSTYEELQDAWKKLLVKDGAGSIVRYPQSFGVKATVPMLPVFFWAFGAEIITEAGVSGLDSAESLAAAEYIQNAFVNLSVSPLGLTGQESDNVFAAGKSSIEWNGPWAINGFKGAGVDLGIALVPAGPAGRFTWGGDTAMVMNKDSENKDTAWALMEYWNSYDSQQYWAKTVAFPPTRVDMTNDPELSKNENLSYFIESAEFAKIYMAEQTKAGQIEEEVMIPLYENITRGLKDAKTALAEAHAALNKILQD